MSSRITIGGFTYFVKHHKIHVVPRDVEPKVMSRIYIGDTLYVVKPTPESKKIPVEHRERVELYTWRGTLSDKDRENFDALSSNYTLGLKFLDRFDGKTEFVRMLKLAHRIRGYC